MRCIGSRGDDVCVCACVCAHCDHHHLVGGGREEEREDGKVVVPPSNRCCLVSIFHPFVCTDRRSLDTDCIYYLRLVLLLSLLDSRVCSSLIHNNYVVAFLK